MASTCSLASAGPAATSAAAVALVGDAASRHAAMDSAGGTAVELSVATDEAIESALSEVNEGLPHYRHLRGFIRTKEPFSDINGQLTANQKLRRKQIEADYQQEIQEAYA